MITSHSFPETQFIAVTAYQNEEVGGKFGEISGWILFFFGKIKGKYWGEQGDMKMEICLMFARIENDARKEMQ